MILLNDQVQEPVDRIERLEFFVPGTPIPQGSKKGFVVGRRAVIVDANADDLKPWRTKVRDMAEHALAERPGFPNQAEVAVILDFYMPRPKTATRRRPTVKPDLDKLIRAILDSLTDSGVLDDDSQVVSIPSQKWYADAPEGVGVHVVVRELA